MLLVVLFVTVVLLVLLSRPVVPTLAISVWRCSVQVVLGGVLVVPFLLC